MFCFNLGEAAVDEFFIQDLQLNFHSFLGFRHGSGFSIKAIMSLSAALPLAVGKWVVIALLFESQPYLDYISSILKIFAYQTSFREDLDKSILSVHT